MTKTYCIAVIPGDGLGMMLEHLDHADAAAAIVKAIETVLTEVPRTRDIGGKASTQEVGKAIAAAIG